MKKYIFVLLLFVLTACGGETSPAGTPTATPNPGEIALQMVQQQMNAEATSQVVALQLQATQQVIGATATQQQMHIYAAQTEQARQDAVATSVQERRDAAATQARADAISTAERQQRLDEEATKQALIALQSTQSANATATFTVMTLTAIPPHATMTQLAVENDIVVNNQEVQKSALDLQRAQDTNKISWMVPALLVIAALIIYAVVTLRKSRWNPISDENGEFQGFGFDEIFVRPNVLPGAVLNLKALPPPMLTDEATVKEILINDQRIRAVAAIPVNPSAAGSQAFNNFFSAPTAKREDAYEIIEAEEIPPQLLDGETLKVLNKDWKEANDK